MKEKIFLPVAEQMELIRRGTVEIIPEEELEAKLQKSFIENKPLNVKLGCDPTRPDLHLGHSVVLKKLAQFQRLGHTAILIIGDFTAMIGDPSGRNATRPPLSFEESRANARSYIEQASKILDKDKTRIVYNSDWLSLMKFEDVIRLASRYTVARMLERDDFTNRYQGGIPISMHELLYPLAQAMDSVAIDADVELGGTDQKFNLLVGRHIQREYEKEPQVILTMPLLIGTDGKEKMSKSYGNYIGISDTPRDIYGKTLSIPDELIYLYYDLVTDISADELTGIRIRLEDKNTNPRDVKRGLARTLVEMYHSKESAVQAEEEFDKIFINNEIPEDIPEIRISEELLNIMDLVMKTGIASGRGEARRLIIQGGVSIDKNKITDIKTDIEIIENTILKIGRRNFFKIKK